jgi:hypothetical protein
MFNCAGLKDDLMNEFELGLPGLLPFCQKSIHSSIKLEEKFHNHLFLCSKAKLPSSFKAFGEIGILTTKGNTTFIVSPRIEEDVVCLRTTL